MAVCMAHTPTVLEVLEVLRANGCRVEHDREAGTAIAWDGETCVYQASSRGRAVPGSSASRTATALVGDG